MTRRRFISVTLCCLILGALLNVGIAWACAVFSPQATSANPLRLTKQEVGCFIDRSPWPFKLRPGPSISSSSFGLEYDLLEPEVAKPVFWNTARAVRAGYPLPSLYGERWSNFDARTPPPDRDVFIAALNPASLGLTGDTFAIRLLPLRPILPGTLTNTIFYAGLFWLLSLAPIWWRNHRRLRRRCCPDCNTALTDPENKRCHACGWIRGITNYRDLKTES